MGREVFVALLLIGCRSFEKKRARSVSIVLIRRWFEERNKKIGEIVGPIFFSSPCPTSTSSYFLVVFFRVCLVIFFSLVFFSVAGGW